MNKISHSLETRFIQYFIFFMNNHIITIFTDIETKNIGPSWRTMNHLYVVNCTSHLQNPPEPRRTHQNPAEPSRTPQNPPEPTRTPQNPPELIKVVSCADDGCCLFCGDFVSVSASESCSVYILLWRNSTNRNETFKSRR